MDKQTAKVLEVIKELTAEQGHVPRFIDILYRVRRTQQDYPMPALVDRLEWLVKHGHLTIGHTGYEII